MSDEIVENKETLVTETPETVPNVNVEPGVKVPTVPQQMAYHGPVHLDSAGQVTPGPKPPLRHELEVDEAGRKLREETSAAGWPPGNVDLMRPTVPEVPIQYDADGKVITPEMQHEQAQAIDPAHIDQTPHDETHHPEA